MHNGVLYKILLCLLIVAPSIAPVISTGSSVDSRTVVIQWDAPSAEHHNGIIRRYIVNITILETGDTWTDSFSGTTAIIGSLIPSFTYRFRVTAYTVAAGPYSTVITIKMPEDGMLLVNFAHFTLYI